MKIKLLFGALLLGLGANAQVTFKVNSPASTPAELVGRGDSVYSCGWGNGDITKKIVTGDLVIANPANGCTAISADLTGKIAIIDRGTCGFAVKAKIAQDAGAVGVIIVNNRTTAVQYSQDSALYRSQGAPLEWVLANVKKNGWFDMSGLASQAENCTNAAALAVKIPAVMVSLEKGTLLKTAVNAGTVNVSIGGGNLYDNNAKLYNEITPIYRTRPAFLATKDLVHDTLGFVFDNVGKNNLKNAFAKATIIYTKDTTIVFQDSVALPETSQGQNDLVIFKTFKPAKDLAVGTYYINYEVVNAGDEYAADNVSRRYFYVNDSLLAVGRVVTPNSGPYAGKQVPSVNAIWNPMTSASANEFKICMLYRHEASRSTKVKSLDFYAESRDSSLFDDKVNVNVYQLNAEYNDIYNYTMKASELSEVFSDSYSFATTDTMYAFASYKFPTNFERPTNNTNYLYCLTTDNAKLYFGEENVKTSGLGGHYTTILINQLPISPIAVGGEYNVFATSNYYQSMALNLSYVNTASVTENKVNAMTVSPNPSTGVFNVKAEAGSLAVNVTDVTGKLVYKFNANTVGTHSIDLAGMEAGVYVATITNNGVTETYKLQVVK